MKFRILMLLLTAAATGCGSSAAKPAPTAVPLVSYKDSQFGFGFRHPANWTIASKGGSMTTVGGVKTYILDVKVPQDVAQVSVTVDGDVAPFPAFQNGKTSPDPNGPTHTFQYFHARVAGWPAMVIKRYTGKQISEIDTVTNTRTRSYDVRMLTISPPFPSDITQGYAGMVKSFTVPFS